MKSQPVLSRKKAREFRVLGIDPGEKYLAWATLRIRMLRSHRSIFDYVEVLDDDRMWKLERTGFIRMPENPGNFDMGTDLVTIDHYFDAFLSHEAQPDIWAMERYTHRPKRMGGNGMLSELINLRLGTIARGRGGTLVRNTDWKTWVMHTFNPDAYIPKSKLEKGQERAEKIEATDLMRRRFLCSTPHEADAAGVALYAGCILLRKHILNGSG